MRGGYLAAAPPAPQVLYPSTVFRSVLVLALPLLPACAFGLTSTVDRADDDDTGEPGGGYYNLCGAPGAPRGTGAWDDPVVVGSVPFLDESDALTGTDDITAYDCGGSERSGQEVTYVYTPRETGRLRVGVAQRGDAPVTVHILQDGAVSGGAVSGCLAADSTVVTADVTAGTTYRIVVDTQGDVTWTSGAFGVEVDLLVTGTWEERRLDDGLVWRRRLEEGGIFGNQAWTLFLADPDVRDVRPRPHPACATVPAAGESLAALVGVNGGFADGACESLVFLRSDDVTFALNNYVDRQRTFAWNDAGTPETTWIERGVDYTSHRHAIGGFPSLVTGGSAFVEPDGSDGFYTSRQARTVMGTTPDGQVALFVADGGIPRSEGLTMTELAQVLTELGISDAVNFEGAGASTAWVRDCSLDGTVNWPTDGGGATHAGARNGPDGVYVF